jgi:tetratricopeptide (TPR) repeat protein
VDLLLSYIEEHAASLVGDLVPSLVEVDPIFRACDPEALQARLTEAVGCLVAYTRGRDPGHLEGAWRAMAALWLPEQRYLSAFVRALVGVEELIAIRGQGVYETPQDFLDVLPVFRATVREALCACGDLIQGRSVGADDGFATTTALAQPVERQSTPTQPIEGALASWTRRRVAQSQSPQPIASEETAGPATTALPAGEDRLMGQRTGPLPAGREAGSRTLGPGRFVSRVPELQKLWERLRVAAGKASPHHEVIGVKAPDGYGKTSLLATFADRVQRHLGRPAVYLRARAPRLFSLPLWPFVTMLRGYFQSPLGDPHLAEKVRAELERLSSHLPERSRDGVDRGGLRAAAPHVLNLLGDESPETRAAVEGLDGRTAGVLLRRSLVTVVHAIGRAASAETGAPLFIEVEDAGEMDAPSWELLHELVREVHGDIRLMILITYAGQVFVPATLARYPGFTELILQPMDMSEAEALIDGLLDPNELEDTTTFRLMTAARGSPLLLYEGTRQLVEDAIIGRRDGTGGPWVEVASLPEEGVIRDLGGVVARRLGALDPTTRTVLEVVTVIEDAMGGDVLEAIVSRRAVGADELMGSIRKLSTAGLLFVSTRAGGLGARIRHPLVRDEIYRQMSTDRRRAVHEDAGEVYERIYGASGLPSLAAAHLAMAGLPGRALHGLLRGVDRELAVHNLVGALELCNQALGLLKGLQRPEYDEFLYEVLHRRERVYGLLTQAESQSADLEMLLPLAERVAEPPVTLRIRRRRAERDEARIFLDEALEAAADAPAVLRGRLHHAHGLFDAQDRREKEGIEHFLDALLAFREAGDLLGEALVCRALAVSFWSRGRPAEATELFERAVALLRRVGEAEPLRMVLLDQGRLHAFLGDFETAWAAFGEVLELGDRGSTRLMGAVATVGRGRVLVNRGDFDDAMRLLAGCLKDLGRVAMRRSVYVDGLNALAMALATYSRGEKLIVGALRYAGEAADRATEMGYLPGLVESLGVQVRGLLGLGRTQEAEARLAELDSAIQAAEELDGRYARLRAPAEFYRYRVSLALGDDGRAEEARDAAWAELSRQAATMEGSRFQKTFLVNVLVHREIAEAAS